MRPSRKLIAGLSLAAALSIAAAHSAWLLGPALIVLASVLALAILDVHTTLREPVLQVQCVLPPRSRLGEPFLATYSLHNSAARALQVMLLDDRGLELGGDLLLGPVTLAPNGAAMLEASWTAQSRGLHRLGPLHVLSTSVLGLFERRTRGRTDSPILRVLPNPGSHTGHLLAPDAESGVRPRRSRGEGMELDSLRPFTEGDDPRHVDWRATARAQQLIVRTFREERNQSLVIAVDV